MRPVIIIVGGQPVPWSQNSDPTAVGGQVRYRPIPKRQTNQAASIKHEAELAMTAAGNTEPYDGPVRLTVTAEVRIPRGFTKAEHAAALAHEIRPTSSPDITKLVRLLEDAIQDIVLTNDARICEQRNIKVYSLTPRTVFVITALPGRGGHPAARKAARSR